LPFAATAVFVCGFTTTADLLAGGRGAWRFTTWFLDAVLPAYRLTAAAFTDGWRAFTRVKVRFVLVLRMPGRSPSLLRITPA